MKSWISKSASACLIASGFLQVPIAQAAEAPSLPRLNIDSKSITVSGISSGAFMAVQLQVIHSSIFSGVGAIAGGIYACADSSVTPQIENCLGSPEKTDVHAAIEKARTEAQEGAIDELSNLRTKKVYIFQSPQDKKVLPAAARALNEFFATFTPVAQIRSKLDLPAAHGFPTVDYGAPCDSDRAPYMLKCGFDSAQAILSHLYGSGLSRAMGVASDERLQPFNQSTWANPEAKMADTGWIYVPQACASGASTCRLHLALHGCKMSPEFIQDQFAKKSGYSDWAEANSIVVLYPQAKVSRDNPFGCWDWFGYTGPNYLRRSGAQIQALEAMVKRVSGSGSGRTFDP